MCINYTPSRKDQISATFQAIDETGLDWRPEAWQDYDAPFITHDHLRQRRVQVGKYSMVPKSKMPPGVKRFSTMNARAETIDQLRSFAQAWKHGQRCLIPLQSFFEPNYESGRAERWEIGMHDAKDFAVAGLFRTWPEEHDQLSFSFTQLTINADQHPLMRRFHKAGEEKRSLVIIAEQDYQAWLECRDLLLAKSLLRLPDAEQMWAKPAALTKHDQSTSAPLATQTADNETSAQSSSRQFTLF